MRLQLPETEIEYRNALIDAAELGAQKALAEIGELKPYLWLRQAQRKYGPSVVERWHREGLIDYLQDGPNAKIRIDRIQIETVAKTANRSSYLTSSERKK